MRRTGIDGIFIIAVMITARTSYAVDVARNVTAIVPETVKFECDSANMRSIFLKKDNATVVHAEVRNSSVILDNENFKGTVFTDSAILLELIRSELKDEGLYFCVAVNETMEIVGRRYMLKVFTKPEVMLPTTRVEIFGGEDIYIVCKGIGIPIPSVSWKLGNNAYQKFPSNVLRINNAAQNQSGMYACVAENMYGISSKQLKVTVKKEFPSPPLLQLINRSETSLQLYGSAPNYVGRGYVIKHYILKSEEVPLQVMVNVSSSFTREIGNLMPASTYRFELTACNPFVCSNPLFVSFSTAEQGKPRQPTHLHLVSRGPTSVTVRWKHGFHDEPVLRSVITYTDGNSKETMESIEGQPHTFAIANLTPFTNYTITVKTCVQLVEFNVSCSDPSKKLEVATNISAPSAPNIVRVKNTHADAISIVVEWIPSKFWNGPAVFYKVFFRMKNRSNWKYVYARKGSLARPRSLLSPEHHELKDLMQMTEYCIMVSAFNDAGSNNSSVIPIKTDPGPPQRPSNLTMLHATPSSIVIQWSPPRDIHPGLEVCYHIGIKRYTGSLKYLSPICNGTNTNMEIKLLEVNTSYVVVLYASIVRPRDRVVLSGKVIEKTFNTAIPARPTEEPHPDGQARSGSLVLVTVLCILVIIAVAGIALLYCQRRKIFSIEHHSVFYVDENGSRPLASRLSMRNAERNPAAVPIGKFADHVAKLHADSDYLFSEEYHSLAHRPDFSWEHSTLQLNQPKNRYQDIVAYDHSRVRLMSLDGVPASNYINANFIDGFQKNPAYIATQAPLNHTIEDFWRMVWEQNVRTIVMLTNLIERGKRKCDQYWPNQGTAAYGVITVKALEEYKYAHYIHRVFTISWNESEDSKGRRYDNSAWKVVRQFHFSDWPDFGIPSERTAILSFVHLVRKYMQENSSPTIVHCSAGVGRSGTFIVIDAQIEQINRKETVNVYGYLKEIRSQRNYLVQQESQYVFVHDVLVDYIQCGLTAIPICELYETLQDYFELNPESGLTVIDEEWQILSEFSISEYKMLSGKRPCNQQKNRDSFIIPVDSSRVKLTMKCAREGTDYINASYVDSYLRKNSFIITQLPLHDTIEDFWRMAWENFSCIIVNLLTDEELCKEDSQSYLPYADCNPINFGCYEIHCISTHDKGLYRLKELEIVGRVEWGTSERRKVYHFQFLDWAENNFPVPSHLFDFIGAVKKTMGALHLSIRNVPVIVHCCCGVEKSGIFCSLWNLQEQMDDIEETVDIFSIVRVMRHQRPLGIQSKASYEYLYNASQSFKERMHVNVSNADRKQKGSSLSMGLSDEVQRLIENMEEDSDGSDI